MEVVLEAEEMPLALYCPALSLVSLILILRQIRRAHQNVASLEFFVENTGSVKAGV